MCISLPSMTSEQQLCLLLYLPARGRYTGQLSWVCELCIVARVPVSCLPRTSEMVFSQVHDIVGSVRQSVNASVSLILSRRLSVSMLLKAHTPCHFLQYRVRQSLPLATQVREELRRVLVAMRRVLRIEPCCQRWSDARKEQRRKPRPKD